MICPDELARLYDAHAGALYAFVLNMTRSEPDSRDLLQELFRRLATNGLPEKLRDERGWLLRSVHNLAIDSIRRREIHGRAQERLTEASFELFAPTPDLDEAVFRRSLATALGALPPEQRAVVHLKLSEGLTFERIADLLEIPLNTAASRYRYALDKLRDQLRPLYDEIR
jgi:RNA polymerase sigma-70 factor (ECF subfamily)